MNAVLKNYLVIVLKIAVAAVLSSVVLRELVHGNFNLTSAADWWNLGKTALSVIVGREAVVWIPIVLNWAQTNVDPSTLQKPAPVTTSKP